jgi:hypothetical protein
MSGENVIVNPQTEGVCLGVKPTSETSGFAIYRFGSFLLALIYCSLDKHSTSVDDTRKGVKPND